MIIEVKLNYDLTPVASTVEELWGDAIKIRLEFQAAKRIFLPELKYIFRKSETFKTAMIPLAVEALNSMLPEIMQKAAKINWNIGYPMKNGFDLNTNGGKKLYVDVCLRNKPTGQPWTTQDLEAFVWR